MVSRLTVFCLVLLISITLVYGATVPPTGGIHYYNFSEVTDLWGSNDATNNGAASTNYVFYYNTSGNSSPTAYDFDPAGTDFVQATDIDPGNITIAAFIKLDDLADQGGIVAESNGGAADRAFILDYRNDGRLEFILYNAAAQFRQCMSAVGAISADIPYHIIATWNSTECDLYINGTSSVNSRAGVFTGPIQDNNNPLWIGKYNDGSTRYTDGLIDDVRIYNLSINSTEALRLFNYGNVSIPINFTIRAYDIITSTQLTNFSASITNGIITQNYSTTSGIIVTNISSGLYNITVSSNQSPGYASRLFSNYDVVTNLNAGLYKQNSILINIFYENGSRILENFTVNFISDLPSTETEKAINGTLFKSNLTQANYTIEVFNSNFNKRSFFLTILDGTFTELNVFFPYQDVQIKNFIVQDNRDIPIEGALVSFTKLINSSYVSVGQAVSDSAGSFTFAVDTFETYRLLVSADNFQTKIFTINTDTTTTSYEIVLLSNLTFNFTTIYDIFSFLILPSESTLNLDVNQTFNITVLSPDSLIQYFGISYNTTILNNVTGSPSGGTALINLNTTDLFNNNITSITLNYFVKIQNENLWITQKNYLLIETPFRNSSLQQSMTDWGQGYSDFEKILLSTLIISLLILAISPWIPTDRFNGTKTTNSIILIAGIILFTSTNFIGQIFGILSAFVITLQILPKGEQ